MKLRNKIYKAIYEGIQKGLLSFENDENNINFEKSSDATQIHIKNDFNTTILTNIKNAMWSTNIFLPKTIQNIITVDQYNFDIRGNKMLVSSDWEDWSHSKRHTTGLLIEADGNKITLNIIPNSTTFYQQKTTECFISDYIKDFAELKKQDGCSTLILDTINFCMPIGYQVQYIALYDNVLDLENIPNKLQIINNQYTIGADDEFKRFVGDPITNRFAVIIRPSDQILENNQDRLKKLVKYLNNVGFNWVFIDKSLFNYTEFSNNLFYNYDIPNLDQSIINYNVKFNIQEIYRFINSTKLYDTTDPEKINTNLIRANGSKKLETLIKTGDIKQINDFINRQIIRFGVVLYKRKMPFYRDYIEHCYSNKLESTAYQFFQYNSIFPLILINPLVSQAEQIGYSKREIFERMDIICRYIEKYGLDQACKNYELYKKEKRGRS